MHTGADAEFPCTIHRFARDRVSQSFIGSTISSMERSQYPLSAPSDFVPSRPPGASTYRSLSATVRRCDDAPVSSGSRRRGRHRPRHPGIRRPRTPRSRATRSSGGGPFGRAARNPWETNVASHPRGPARLHRHGGPLLRLSRGASGMQTRLRDATAPDRFGSSTAGRGTAAHVPTGAPVAARRWRVRPPRPR